MTERDLSETHPRIGDNPNPGANPDGYPAFWQRYLLLHRKEGSRRMHYLGSAFAPLLLLWALIQGPLWLLLFVPLAGYLPAWAGHFLIEGNRPATFGHPFWSLWSDYRMLGLWLAGRLEREYARHGIA